MHLKGVSEVVVVHINNFFLFFAIHLHINDMVCYTYMYITIINLYTKFCLLTNTDITIYTHMLRFYINVSMLVGMTTKQCMKNA